MMPRNIFAYTAPGPAPDFMSLNERDGQIVLDVRGNGITIAVQIPRQLLADMARALVCEVLPASSAADIDSPPARSAVGLLDGVRQQGSTGQPFEVKDGRWE